MINRTMLLIIETIAIVFGLIAIFSVVKDTELIVGVITISFGILAIIWSIIALTSLSRGTSLRKYITYYLIALIFLLLFSSWRSLGEVFSFKNYMVYPEYLFISLAYLIFVLASYKVYKIGKEFGFKDPTPNIKNKSKNNPGKIV